MSEEQNDQQQADPDAIKVVQDMFERHPDAIEGMDENVFCRIFNSIVKQISFWGG